MAVRNFTARSVEALPIPKERQVDYFDDSKPGFGIRVSYGGRRTWFVMYRYNGKRCRMNLGLFPETSLKDAREAADSALALARKGSDPAKARRQPSVRMDTVDDLAKRYITDISALDRDGHPKKRSWRKDQRMLDHDVLSRIGATRIEDVTRKDIREILDEIVGRRSFVQANRTLEVVRRLFNWAIETLDLSIVNPAARIPKPGGEEKGRSRFLNEAELKAFWAALDPSELTERGAAAFKLLLLTAQREMEVLHARWDEIDFDDATWVIPEDRAKNRNESVVPLPPHALDLLRAIKADSGPRDRFVFQSPTKTDAPVVRNYIEKRILKVRKLSGIRDVTTHDLRRTATTWWGKLRLQPHVKKLLLNHKRSARDATNTYDRFEYLDEKRDALARWETLLLGIVGQRDGSPEMPQPDLADRTQDEGLTVLPFVRKA